MAEQRLIDAYKLMQAMYDRAFETDGDTMWQSGCWVRYRAVEQVIRAQPTIEERNTGKWILDYEQDPSEVFNGNYRYICSECGKKDIHARTQEVPFCWHCGAKMEGVENG